MEEFPKNQETSVGENTGAEALTEMPTFEEHMEEMGKRESLGEKYYQQAEAERERWVEMSRAKLEKAENLNPDGFVIVENFHKYASSGKKEGFRQINLDSEKDVAKFNEYKTGRIKRAEEQMHDDEQVNLDELAKCFENEEMINKIGEKLEHNEDFTDEELKFLNRSEIPASIDNSFWGEDEFMTPGRYYDLHHDIITTPSYRDLLENESGSPLGIVARAQMREAEKQGSGLLHNDNES